MLYSLDFPIVLLADKMDSNFATNRSFFCTGKVTLVLSDMLSSRFAPLYTMRLLQNNLSMTPSTWWWVPPTMDLI